MTKAFSLKRFRALLRKEWLQMLRDPITLRFIIALPMMQLFLFGYALNSNPKNLPAGLLTVEHSKYERSLISALHNTGYYDVKVLSSEAEAERGLARGELLFEAHDSGVVPPRVNVPPLAGYSPRDLVGPGEPERRRLEDRSDDRPRLLVEGLRLVN